MQILLHVGFLSKEFFDYRFSKKKSHCLCNLFFKKNLPHARCSCMARKIYQKHILLQKLQHPSVNSKSLKSAICDSLCVRIWVGMGYRGLGIGMISESNLVSTQSDVKSLAFLEPYTHKYFYCFFFLRLNCEAKILKSPKVSSNKHLFDIKRNSIRGHSFRQKLKLCPNYRVKARGFYEKAKGNNCVTKRKEVLQVLIS